MASGVMQAHPMMSTVVPTKLAKPIRPNLPVILLAGALQVSTGHQKRRGSTSHHLLMCGLRFKGRSAGH